ncbi:hypothetical protein Patl1_03656 [Pistacia atlantica]|uniref:Uncharacterized protein n=1 Tax=Pistacia atlantica TaxID=434234 RepID=A0ACC1C4F1_9ROSI|nr:hypothetical protein Patl1_03656 [Pistacia atlantica]
MRPSVRNFKSLRLQKSAVRNNYQAVIEPSWRLITPPATQLVVCQVPLTTNEEFRAPIFTTKWAFPSWRNTLVTTRQRIMFKFQELIQRDMYKLAMNITTEHGKTLEDAHNDVLHGLAMIPLWVSLPYLFLLWPFNLELHYSVGLGST